MLFQIGFQESALAERDELIVCCVAPCSCQTIIWLCGWVMATSEESNLRERGSSEGTEVMALESGDADL